MKISTIVLLMALCLFIFAPDRSGARIADDIRAVGFDIQEILSFNLINVKV